jgi:hypothetical protein
MKTWAYPQKHIKLSSGEAELVAAAKMSTELIGVLQLAKEWDIDMSGAVYVDCAAAVGIVERKGDGKMRHVEVGMLRVQEQQERGKLKCSKVVGTENPGDLMTKYVTRKVAENLLEILGQKHCAGRANVNLKV